MSERPGPDLDQVRDALRRHDERHAEDDERPAAAPEPDAGDGEEEGEDREE
jgi:hypothetical protein